MRRDTLEHEEFFCRNCRVKFSNFYSIPLIDNPDNVFVKFNYRGQQGELRNQNVERTQLSRKHFERSAWRLVELEGSF